MGKTLFDKVWDAHVVERIENGPEIIYIDRHLIHEVTSPQAFKEIEQRGISILRPKQIVATADHNVPTINQHLPIRDKQSREQVEALQKNCKKHNIELWDLGHENQGIIHIIAPELGITQPGMSLVCGDSHTSTHGAFGCIAFGIGTSQVAMVFASQCILMNKPKSMRITVEGKLRENVLPKDVILYIISQIGTDGGTGYFCEYAGNVIEEMSMEGRMTVCNMSIEMGARGGMIAPDETTFNYIKDRPYAPKYEDWDNKLNYWKTLKSDDDAKFDLEYTFKAEDIEPMVTYGTNPGMGIGITHNIPNPKNESEVKALNYMDLREGQKLSEIAVNYIFIGSCTNARIEDFRIAAKYIKGKQKAPHIKALIVPGSYHVAEQIKSEGLEEIFNQAGFEIREAGCSACLAMNEDKIPEGEYCVSTSNRNFEGRQGPGSKTLLASPLTAAMVAVEGKISAY